MRTRIRHTRARIMDRCALNVEKGHALSHIAENRFAGIPRCARDDRGMHMRTHLLYIAKDQQVSYDWKGIKGDSPH